MGALKEAGWILGNVLTCGALELLVNVVSDKETAPDTPETFTELQQLHIGDPVQEEKDTAAERAQKRQELAEHDQRHRDFLEWAKSKGATISNGKASL